MKPRKTVPAQSQEEEIEKLLCYWASRLRLQSWTFEFAVVDWWELGDGAVAEVLLDENYKHACLRFVKTNHRPLRSSMGGLEHDVVHELLHVVMGTTQSEYTLNMLAEALVGERKR